MGLPSYRFGPFLLDRPRYRVLRGEHPVELSPKLLDLLIFLVEHREDLVTKEALLDALWAAANVTENALAQAISELRQALDDDAQTPRYIKTVARRGYRFVAPVEELDVVPALRRSQAAPPPSPSTEETPTVAVVNFDNVTRDLNVDWLSAGIAETVAADLRALGRFRVIDRSRLIEAARHTDGSLHQLATFVGAMRVVMGSYQLRGDLVRITARMVDIERGEALADAKIDGPLASIFELQDEIVRQLASTLVPVASAAGARPITRETSSLDAYRAVTEGWLKIESLDIRQLESAVQDFAHAITLDEGYALAHTGLASAQYALSQTSRSDNTLNEELLSEVIAHARRAVDLDPGLAEAHATLSMALVDAWKTPEAVAAARRAVALEPAHWRHMFRLAYATWGDARLQAASGALALYPDFAFSHFQMAMVYVARAQLAQAETVLLDGLAMQGRQTFAQTRFPALGLEWLRGLIRLARGDADGALAAFDREEALTETTRLFGREYAMASRFGRGCALLRAGRLPESETALRSALALYPEHAQSLLALGSVLRVQGNVRDAASVLDAASAIEVQLAQTRPLEAAMVRAQRYAVEGHVNEAAHGLMEMLAAAPPGFAGWTIPVEPLLSQLQQDQLFAPVLSRLSERAR